MRAASVELGEHGYKEGESSWNKAFGSAMDKRLEKAMFDFQIAVDEWRRRRRVDEINIAVFGFSRGSATARSFVHWLAVAEPRENPNTAILTSSTRRLRRHSSTAI